MVVLPITALFLVLRLCLPLIKSMIFFSIFFKVAVIAFFYCVYFTQLILYYKYLLLRDMTVYKLMLWSWDKIPKFSIWYSVIIYVLLL